MRSIISVFLIIFVMGCNTDLSADSDAHMETLRGRIVEKPWTKSAESWNAGGSEYYVLDVGNAPLPDGRRTAKEGVILRPSDKVSLDIFRKFRDKQVVVQGIFVAGEPYKPRQDVIEQMPVSVSPEIGGTRETVYPVRGSGFKVYKIRSGTK